MATYAKLCKINRTSLYDRVKAGTLFPSPLCEGFMIDLEEFPPSRMKHAASPAVKRDLPDWCYK